MIPDSNDSKKVDTFRITHDRENSVLSNIPNTTSSSKPNKSSRLRRNTSQSNKIDSFTSKSKGSVADLSNENAAGRGKETIASKMSDVVRVTRIGMCTAAVDIAHRNTTREITSEPKRKINGALKKACKKRKFNEKMENGKLCFTRLILDWC